MTQESGLAITKRRLYVSPHPDDVAISIGASVLARHTRHDAMVTIFDGEGSKSEQAKVVRRRREEDVVFARFADLNLVSGGIVEAAHRSSPFPRKPYLEAAVRVLCDAANRYEPDLLVSPLAIGSHADHVLAREAAELVAEREAIKIKFYEDLPYAARPRFAGWNDSHVVAGLRPNIAYFDNEILTAKLTAISLYPSQIPILWPRENKTYANELRKYCHPWSRKAYAERFWEEAQ